jgi:hypothetical protein
LYKRLGLKLNKDNEKWTFLDVDENGSPLTYREQVTASTLYFKSSVMTGEFMERNRLPDRIAPSLQQLYDTHLDFMGAMRTRGILYSDVLIEAGYPLNYASDLQRIGHSYHRILEQVVMEHARENGCLSYCEVTLNANQKKLGEKKRRCDVAMVVNENLKKLSPALTEFCSSSASLIPFVFESGMMCYQGHPGEEQKTLRNHITVV